MTFDFRPWLDRWTLTPDGPAFSSLAGMLMPVVFESRPAMLKLTREPEELAGGALMQWWGGHGAALVLAREGEALLLERAMGAGSLAQMAREGRDDEATRILCAAGARLHAPRASPPPASLFPLEPWFRALWPAAETHGGVLLKSAAAARALLAEPREVAVLHGDLHHGNVLDFGPRGWLAIDPKGLVGERGYDHANMMCNPDADAATAPGVLARRVTVVSEAARIEPVRLLRWLLAYLGLSASWSLGDGPGDAGRTLQIAEMAAQLLEAAAPQG
jgi:streptomycin 6-kinase